MKDAFQYSITQGFGYDPSYQGNTQHFHNGIDYGAPEGTPIIVNNTLIGLVGHTGRVYDRNGQNSIDAAHLHVGHWNGSQVLDPHPQGGKTISGAVVTEIAQDSVNGKYVRVADADSTSWVYLHMSDNSKVKVGDALIGTPEGYTMDDDLTRLIYNTFLNHEPDAASLGAFRGKDPHTAIFTIATFQEHVDYQNKITQALAAYDKPDGYKPVTEQLYRKG